MVGGLGGELLSALTTAGAFAAFLSTSSGLTIAVAGVLSQDVMGRRFRGVRAFQAAAVVAVVVPLCCAVTANGVGVARAVGLAFAVAASTFCPLLVLGHLVATADRRRAPWPGCSSAAGRPASRWSTPLLQHQHDGWASVLLSHPAAWTAPAGFAAMILVSLATQHRLPPNVSRTMVRLHTPEAVELDRGPVAERLDGRCQSPRGSARSDRSSSHRRRTALTARRRTQHAPSPLPDRARLSLA